MTCRGKRTPIGEARLFKRVIPSADDARRRVETAWVWISVMEATRGHYRVAAGDRGTVRSAPTSEGAEPHRNDAVTLAAAGGVTECFLLGSLVAHAPFYSGILQGLQVSDVTPYS